ncbi:MAG: hypothetical protein ACI9FO_000321 [Methylophagaceae bacterium]|jgi:hypothetical protein
MVNKENLQEENTRWHEEHSTWIQETELWQHETRRLLALLYLLERALPEHSSMLKKHAILIAKNERQLSSYECDIDENTDVISQEKHTKFHQKLSNIHEEAKQEHLKLKHTYTQEMGKFKSLVLKLLNEC